MLKKITVNRKKQTVNVFLDTKNIHGVFGLNGSGKTDFLDLFKTIEKIIKVDMSKAIDRYKTKNIVKKVFNNKISISASASEENILLSAELAEDDTLIDFSVQVIGKNNLNLIKVGQRKRMFYNNVKSNSYIKILKELVNSFSIYDTENKYPNNTDSIEFIRKFNIPLNKFFNNQIRFLFGDNKDKICIIDDFGCGMHPALVSELVKVMAQKQETQFIFASNHIHLARKLKIEQIVFCESIAGGSFAFNPSDEYLKLNLNTFEF